MSVFFPLGEKNTRAKRGACFFPQLPPKVVGVFFPQPGRRLASRLEIEGNAYETKDFLHFGRNRLQQGWRPAGQRAWKTGSVFSPQPDFGSFPAPEIN